MSALQEAVKAHGALNRATATLETETAKLRHLESELFTAKEAAEEAREAALAKGAQREIDAATAEVAL